MNNEKCKKNIYIYVYKMFRFAIIDAECFKARSHLWHPEEDRWSLQSADRQRNRTTRGGCSGDRSTKFILPAENSSIEGW